MGRPLIDISGNKYNHLTVIERDGVRGINPMWLCQCDCGAKTRVAGSDLKSGRVTSCRNCGTQRGNLKRAVKRKITDKGDHVEIDLSSEKVPNALMKMDHKDLHFLTTGCYVTRGRGNLVYACKSGRM